MKQFEKGLICGIVLSARYLVEYNDEPTLAQDLLSSNNITNEKAIKAGADEDDIKVISEEVVF